jgi:hypothetical protein
MSQTDLTALERWASDIESLSKKLHAHAKAILASGDDPFAQREQMDRADKALHDINPGALKAPGGLRKSIETACVEASAEFWQRFCSAAKDAGWDVHGATERRLVAWAYFVELKNDAVVIEGVPGKLSPHVPAVIGTLQPHLDSLTADKGFLHQFSAILAEAYDALGGQGEIPIESVFRQCVLLVQPATFWVAVEPSKFRALSRPMFRSRLSAMLAENARLPDGRELRLTPTVNRKDVWELFSPTEGRVVQVGRIAFLKR